jgi:hypothetical protein
MGMLDRRCPPLARLSRRPAGKAPRCPGSTRPAWRRASTCAAQRAGQEPLADILHRDTAGRHGGIPVLRNTFEPLPLYAVLGRCGFQKSAIFFRNRGHEAKIGLDQVLARSTAAGVLVLQGGALVQGIIPRLCKLRLRQRSSRFNKSVVGQVAWRAGFYR